MQQLEFFDIPNPCIGICISGKRGFCKGCFRSREERQFWNEVDLGVKRKIIKACALRKHRYELAQSKKQVINIEVDQQDLFD